ncbi:hypothetical protein OS493_005164 [Desmophyllum pertusum]|uniref:Uncharacterized protein n=1 Tax=Desmophyllum pertusum TaxID=174260 RepID=A0A9W9Z4B8_9CNID|nr:hypothetical protein OS493_005164 [Desmophyllum pertusum]
MVATRLISSMFCILLVSSCLVFTEAYNSNNGKVGKRSQFRRALQRTFQADFAHQQKARDAEMAKVKWDKRNN